MTENILIVNFHTLPCHKMTPLGLWRANLGLKLTPKDQIWHYFVINCNISHIFSICDVKMFKFLCSPLIRTQWSFLGVLWLYQCPKWTPKGPNLTSFVPRYSLFVRFCLFVPKAHLHHLFLKSFKKMVKKSKSIFQKTGCTKISKDTSKFVEDIFKALKLNLIFLWLFKFNLSGSFQFGEFPLANFRILLLLLKLYSNTTFFFIKLLKKILRLVHDSQVLSKKLTQKSKWYTQVKSQNV